MALGRSVTQEVGGSAGVLGPMREGSGVGERLGQEQGVGWTLRVCSETVSVNQREPGQSRNGVTGGETAERQSPAGRGPRSQQEGLGNGPQRPPPPPASLSRPLPETLLGRRGTGGTTGGGGERPSEVNTQRNRKGRGRLH